MFDDTVIKKSGQLWKGIASGALVILGFLAAFFGVLTLSGTQLTSSFALVLVGIVLASIGLAFACVAIRCPKCGAKWVWLAMKDHPAGAWIAWLMSQARCPTCKQSS
ncbi:MAG: hypothetical protein JWM63_4235 [Gammaproteobacteria bacterium]|nr:hypothetical protein [Gammaproteobacteria bacterium]